MYFKTNNREPETLSSVFTTFPKWEEKLRYNRVFLLFDQLSYADICWQHIVPATDSYCYWQFFTAPDSYWQLLATADIFWELLRATDSSWQQLTSSERYWQLRTSYDSYWQLRTATDSFYQLLTLTDSYCGY